MSQSDHDLDGESGGDGSNGDKEEYQVLHTPVGDAQPGETVELAPEVAAAFADNLHPAGEDPPEQEGVRSQVVGQSTGEETLADQDGPAEAGEYEVYRTPIGEHQPGETAYFEEGVANAFADNLLPTDGTNSDSAVEGATDDVEATDESDDTSDAEDDANAGDDTEDDERSYDSPEEFLDQTVPEVRDGIEEADLTDEQLETLREAEEQGKDRNGVKNAIDDALEG